MCLFLMLQIHRLSQRNLLNFVLHKITQFNCLRNLSFIAVGKVNGIRLRNQENTSVVRTGAEYSNTQNPNTCLVSSTLLRTTHPAVYHV